MVFGLMKKGDEVLSITNEFVAIKRKNGEVDVIPITNNGDGWRMDIENIITIGYGNNTVSFENEDGVQIIHF